MRKDKSQEDKSVKKNMKKKHFSRKDTYIRHRFMIIFSSIVFPFFLYFAISYYLLSSSEWAPIFSLSNAAIWTIVLGVLCVVLAYVSSYYIMKTIFLPLEKLSDASKRVAQGDYDVNLTYTGHIAELQHVINNFNFMVEELNSVEIMRNDFIANVSHEFKTPLSSITGYVTLLQDENLSTEEREEYIRLAFFNIEKLNDLTGNILQLSKLEHQSSNIPINSYRLDEQVREAIVLLEPKWSQKQIDFDIDMQEITHTGPQALLFQVWTNLISNAIKFSHTGGKISIRLSSTPDGIKVLFSDEGIGMSEQTMARIFEKFYQGDSSRREQGNGLGLALCKQILDKCNGKIYVSSTLGNGATFMVVLQ